MNLRAAAVTISLAMGLLWAGLLAGGISAAAPRAPAEPPGGQPLAWAAAHSGGASPQRLITETTVFAISGQGVVEPGRIFTLSIQIVPDSSDGEDVDGFLYYAPQGWTILSISNAPAATGCGASTTQDYNHLGGRGVAYWGGAGADLSTDPPSVPSGSECGPYAEGSTLNFQIVMQVDAAAATCPGSNRVGIPVDSTQFTDQPVLDESMPSWLYGDGSGTLDDVSTIKFSIYLPCPAPDVTLEKTVSHAAADCPPGGVDSLAVAPTTTVRYCYRMINNSPLVTVSLQSIDDDVLGALLTGAPLVIGPGASAYVSATQLITGAVGACLTNTATYTATTATGFGQSPVDNALDPFSVTAYSAVDQDSAEVCISDLQLLYLPLILK